MGTTATYQYIPRSRRTSLRRRWTMPRQIVRYDHPARIREELEALGISRVGLATMEAHYLPNLIDADEHLGGIVYGFYPEGFAVLVATDKKIIFLDRKPLFMNEDEITYDVVSGVSLEHAGVGSTVTLHTRIKDYVIRAYNQQCIHNFVRYIDTKCLAYKHIQGKEI